MSNNECPSSNPDPTLARSTCVRGECLQSCMTDADCLQMGRNQSCLPRAVFKVGHTHAMCCT